MSFDSALRTPHSELSIGAEHRTISAKDSELRTPNSELSILSSLDEALAEIQSRSLSKVLFEGEGTGKISSYVSGWMASQGIDVIVLDGANRFDPYAVSFFARQAWIPPEKLLKRIRIARAFTCYQMATLMSETLAILFKHEGAILKDQKPWVILLGPLTTFLDEDVPEREAGPLLERSLMKLEALTSKEISFLLFQPFVSSRSKRAYLMKKLLQFSNLVWKICLDGEGPRVTLEKGPGNTNENWKLQNEKCKSPEKILPLWR